MRKLLPISVLAIFICMLSATHAQQPFMHPGMLHKQSDFDRMKTNVDANAAPWKAGGDKLVANSHSSSTYALRGPADTVYRGSGTPENYNRFLT